MSDKSHYEATGKLCPKIDVYRKGVGYLHSTNWHRTCRDAVQSAAKHLKIDAKELYARFASRT